MTINRDVLAAIGLGLNAPRWGLRKGIGLRWSLPAATTIHDGSVPPGVPRGWPNGGYRIYRTDAKDNLIPICALLGDRHAPEGGWTSPYSLGSGINIDWAAGAGAGGGTLADAIAAAGSALIRLQGSNQGVRLVFHPQGQLVTIAHGIAVWRALNSGGALLQQGRDNFTGSSTITIPGPDVAFVEIELIGAVLDEICIISTPPGPRGDPIHIARPITDVPTILATVPPARRTSTDWTVYSHNVLAAIANVDARFTDVSTNAGSNTTSGMPIVDLLLLIAVDPVIAELLGLLWWDRNAPGGDLLYWITGTWNGVEYGWPLGPISEQPPAAFALPSNTGLTAWALPPVITGGTSGVSNTATAAAIDWTTAPQGLAAATAARFAVARRRLPFGTAPATVAAAMADPASFTALPIADVLASSDPVPYRVRDAGFPEGFLGWSITGYDLFGRPSTPVGVGPISIWDTLPPPPPSNLRGVWLDANAAGSATTPPTDPLMTAQHQAWMLANPSVASAFYIGLDWPPSSAVAAPTTREFRFYARRSDDMPRLAANIVNVNAVSGDATQSQVVLDTALPAESDQLIGGTLSDGRGRFTITAVAPSSSATPWVQVNNLLQPAPIAITPSNDPPGTSTFTPSSNAPAYVTPTVTPIVTPPTGKGCRLRASTLDPEYWVERLAIVPIVAPLASTVLDIVSDTTAGDVRTVVLDLAAPIAHPNPSAGIYVESGSVQIGGATYPTTLVTLDAQRTLPTTKTTLQLTLQSTDTTAFAAGKGATWFPGLGIYLPHATYRNPGELRTFLLVTASAANDSHAPAAVDDPVHGIQPQWQESGQPRHGFESSTASPATLTDLSRVPPAPPAAPESAQLASWPDLSGNATAIVRWMPSDGIGYLVTRAGGATVFAFDRLLRASLGSAYGADETGETGNLLALTSLTLYPDPSNPGSPDYGAIFAANPGLLRRIASLAGNAGAFASRMTKPLGSSDCTSAPPPQTFSSDPSGNDILAPGLWLDTRTGNLAYADSLGGIGTTLYFYRVLAVDPIGNRSTLGKSGTPVELRIKQIPRMPPFTAVRIGDMAITVLWSNPSDGSIDRYQVYTAPDRATLSSVDVLAPTTVQQPTIVTFDSSVGYAQDSSVPTPTAQTPPPGLQWGWLGTGLPPTDFYISVVAEKDVPNGATLRSAPSVPMRIRPKEQSAPGQPQILSLTSAGASATIQFTLDEPWHGYLLELRIGNSRVWSAIAPFTIPPSLPATVSFAIPSGVPSSVRLRAQNGGGVLSAPVIASVP